MIGMTSKVRNRRSVLAVAIISVAAVLTGVWAIAAGGAGAPASTSTADATWTPSGQLPGTPLALSRPSARVASGVDAAVAISQRRVSINPASVREVVASEVVGGLGMRVITARATSGEACYAMVTNTGGARSFHCFRSQSGGGALVRYAASGGTVIGNVEWVNLVGFARSDVARVTLVTQEGSEQDLSLNRSRGFSYSSQNREAFPAALRAYDASGSLIQELPTLP
jgi:hypothetical protein